MDLERKEMGRYLALDIGAESGRLIAITIDGSISTTEIARFSTPVTTDEKGRRCWNFPLIKVAIEEALTKAAKSGPYRSLAVDTWGLDFALIDDQGDLVSLPVSHRDHRTDGYLAKAIAKVGLKRLHGESGCQLLEINSIYQLFAITEQTPEELKNAAHLQLIPDLILYALTGVIGTEYTIASTSGLYDIVKNEWAQDLIRDFNLPSRIFGDVQPAGTIRGQLTEAWKSKTGIGELTCIATASHDTASAVVATPLTSPGSAYISSGTWSLLGVELPKPVINELTLNHRLSNEGGYNQSIRLLRNVMGLWLIQEVRRDLQTRGDEFSYAQLVEMAAAEPDPWRTLIYVDARIFIHAGEMINRIQRFARESDQPIPETPGQLAQCVFASLALQYAATCEVLQQCSGMPMPAIHIVGGGSQNEHLSQLTADVSGRDVIAGPVEAAAMGNAIVQAITLGEVASIEEGRELIKSSDLAFKTFTPRIDGRIVELSKLRERYHEISKKELL